MTTLTIKRTEREALDKAALIETVLIKGDLAKLSVEERNAYYLRVCESAGLNPLTKPLEYITLNSKLVLYALRSCTDQLRTIHKISVVDMDREESDGVCIVTLKVANADGRTDIATGAVFVGALKGEARANAIMKAETKAKRRATLSICGLGLLDETEVETIPGAAMSGAEKVITGDSDPPIDAEQLKALQSLVDQGKTDIEKFCAYFKIEALPNLRKSQFENARAALWAKVKKPAKKPDAAQ